LEISTGKLTASNAGHEYPVLRQADGNFELVKDEHGVMVGARKGMKYTEYELTLEKGSKLFVYTDGVPEATDAQNNLFGVDRMVEALNWNPGDPPAELLFNVRRAVDGFVQDAEQYDDLTMLCIEYKGTVQTDELTVEASAQNLHMVQAFIDGRLDAAGCPLDTKMQVDTAAEEIFGNIAYYAYAPDKGDVSVRALVSDDPRAVLITFTDYGKPYNPLEKTDPDVTLPRGKRQVGGLGIFMTKKLMDEVSYRFEDGKNILTLKKYF
jgi:sigma-B regulation protein RsbU (phosphoserine phosphatase)